MDFITRQQTVRAIRQAAAARGFTGDLWAHDIPLLGTLQQELAICDISIDANPGMLNRWDAAFIKRLARAAVLTSPKTAAPPPKPQARRAW